MVEYFTRTMSTKPSTADTIKADATSAVTSLIDTLKMSGVAQGQNLESFAHQYAPEYARIAVLLGAATVAGDAANMTRYQTDIDALNTAAVLAAVEAGITIEAAEESTFVNVLNTFVNVLVAAAIKAV